MCSAVRERSSFTLIKDPAFKARYSSNNRRLFTIRGSRYTSQTMAFTFDLCASWSSTARYMQWPSEEISLICSCFWASVWAKIKPSWCRAPCRFSTSASAILLSRSFSWAAFLSWTVQVNTADLRLGKKIKAKRKQPVVQITDYDSWIIFVSFKQCNYDIISLKLASSRLPWRWTVTLLHVMSLGREGSFHPSFLSLGYSWLFDLLLFSVSRLHALNSV